MITKTLSSLRFLSLLLIFVINGLIAQNTQTDQAQNNQTDQEKSNPNEAIKGNSNEAIDPLAEFRYLPRQSLGKDYVDGDYERRIFTRITNYIAQTKDELRSFYQTLNAGKDRINQKIAVVGRSYYSINRGLTTNIYQNIINFDNIKNNFFLDRNIRRLTQIEEFYNYSYDTISLVVDREILEDVAYNVESLLGILYLYKGTPSSLNKAIKKFEYLLGDNRFKVNYAENNPQRKRLILEHLTSIHDYLFRYFDNRNIPLAQHHKLMRLENKWDLVTMNHTQNEKLKKAKHKRLLVNGGVDTKALRKSKRYAEFVETFENIVLEETGKPNLDVDGNSDDSDLQNTDSSQ